MSTCRHQGTKVCVTFTGEFGYTPCFPLPLLLYLQTHNGIIVSCVKLLHQQMHAWTQGQLQRCGWRVAARQMHIGKHIKIATAGITGYSQSNCKPYVQALCPHWT